MDKGVLIAKSIKEKSHLSILSFSSQGINVLPCKATSIYKSANQR